MTSVSSTFLNLFHQPPPPTIPPLKLVTSLLMDDPNWTSKLRRIRIVRHRMFLQASFISHLLFQLHDNCLGLSSSVFMISEMQSSSAQNRLRTRVALEIHSSSDRNWLRAQVHLCSMPPWFGKNFNLSETSSILMRFWLILHYCCLMSQPQDLTPPNKLLQILQRVAKLEPKEKEENHRNTMTQEDLQLAIQVKKNWTLSWWEQFTVVCRRTFKERCRDYFDKLRLVQALGIAVLLGLLWWKSQIGTEAQLRDQVFPFEKIYLVEKRKADMYRPSVQGKQTCTDQAYTMRAAPSATSWHMFSILPFSWLLYTSWQGAGDLFRAAVLNCSSTFSMLPFDREEGSPKLVEYFPSCNSLHMYV
ncbi:hypothetical protein ACOSQ3_030601 [Xanthoceras sorbifolium]